MRTPPAGPPDDEIDWDDWQMPQMPVLTSGSSGRRHGRPRGSFGWHKFQPVHTEPLGDGRERHFIAAWLSPDDKHQIGQPVSPSEFAELTAEQFHASIREESYVVRLLDGLDDDARRRAINGNASNRSVAARSLYRPAEAARTAEKKKETRRKREEKRGKKRKEHPE